MSGFWDQSFAEHSRDGYWNPTTATANFCEEDYLITFYVAEFINTLSNLAYVYYAFNPPKLGLSDNRSQKATWDIHTFTLLSIGITSAIFHWTLRQIPQFFDETSMYLLIAGFAFELLTSTYTNGSEKSIPERSNKPFLKRYNSLLKMTALQALITTIVVVISPRALAYFEVAMVTLVSFCALRIGSILLDMYLSTENEQQRAKRAQSLTTVQHQHRGLVGAVIVCTLVGTSTITLYSGDLSIHSVTFATFVLICGFKAGNMIRQQQSATRSQLYWHLLSAYITLNVAFGLWLIDASPAWCTSLRNIRAILIEALPPYVGTGVSFLTELHGWWHILTARAAAEFISLIRHITRNAPAQSKPAGKL